jgi:hypothetical protein
MNALTLEDVYEALARGIDDVGDRQAEVYLAKVCLSLAQALGDPARAVEIAQACKSDLG